MKRVTFVILLALGFAVTGCNRGTAKADEFEQLADPLLATNAWPGAAYYLEQAVRYDGNEPRRWVKLGRAQLAMGRPELAALSFQHGVDLDPSNIEGLQNLAVLYVRAQRYDDARQYVTPLLTLSPNDPAGILASGAIAFYEKRYPEAEKFADQLIALLPDSKEGYVLKAHVLEGQGRTQDAARILDQRLNLDPNDVELARQMLALYRKAGDVAGVRRASIILAKLRPDDPRYQMETARAYYARGERDAAAKIIQTLEDRFRTNAEVIGAIADYKRQRLPRDEALAEIVRLTRNATPLTKAVLCDRLIEMGAVPQALAILSPYARQPVTGENSDAQATLAVALMRAGRAQQALDRAEAVLAFDGANGDALLTRAQARLARGDLGNALLDAQLITSEAPTNAPASLLVAQIYDAQHNDVLADKQLAETMQRLPQDYDVLNARVGWLTRKGRALEASQVAGLFVHSGSRDRRAWSLYADACAAAQQPLCQAEARAFLAGKPQADAG